MAESGGRRSHAADAPDATRVFDERVSPMSDSVGRHAGGPAYAAEEPPVRRRGAPEPYQGSSSGFGGRGGGLRPDMRRKALITAAVAVPAVLGLSVALAVSSSGKSPDGGSPAPGPAQQSDTPSSGSTDDTVPSSEPIPASTSSYGHTGYTHHTYTPYPPSTRGSADGSSTSVTGPSGTGSRTDQPTGPASTPSTSSDSSSSTTSSTSQGPTSPSSTASSHPTSSPS